MLLLRVELAATGCDYVLILGPNAAETIAKGIVALEYSVTSRARHMRVSFFFTFPLYSILID